MKTLQFYHDPERILERTKILVRHPFHILESSLLPFFVSTSLFFLILGIVGIIHPETISENTTPFLGSTGGMGFGGTLLVWYYVILKESKENHHTKEVQYGLKLGMIFFILSEVMFFFAFFGAFFHYSLSPSIAIGNIGPPVGTQELHIGGLPLTNTILLVSSGVTITIAHGGIIVNKKQHFSFFLFLTILLGINFLACQFYEYKYGLKFSGRGNIFGSIFYITTGFHGVHVIIGTALLLLCGTRTTLCSLGLRQVIKNEFNTTNNKFNNFTKVLAPLRGDFSADQHIGFETAAGYGHFVDVVGLFLFISIYGWGGF